MSNSIRVRMDRLLRVCLRVWQQFVAVDVEDEALARRGTLFNNLMVLATFVSTVVALAVFMAGRRGVLPGIRAVNQALIFPVGFLLLNALCFVLVKQGTIDIVVKAYVWISFLAILFGASLLSGAQSVAWILLFWPITLASTLLKPRDGIYFSLIGLGFYGLTGLVQRAGLYEPIILSSPESFRFIGLGLTWLMLITTGGFVNFVNVRSLRTTVSELEQTSRALDRARSEMEDEVRERTRELRTRAEQFQAIAELSRMTVGIRDLQTLLDTAANLIAEQLNFYHVGLFFMDPSGDWVTLQSASSEGGKRMLARAHRLRVGQQGIVGYVAETGLPRFAFDVGEDRTWFSTPELPETRSEMALPLISSDRMIGVLDIQTERPAAFDEGDVARLRVLAGTLAVAIDNVRLFEEMQETLAQLERYQEEDAVRAWRQALSRRRMSLGYSYISGRVRERQSDLSLDGVDQGEGRVIQEETEAGNYRLTAPVYVSGQRLGALTFKRSGPWSDESVRLVESVVEQLDLALNNARLLEQTRLQATQEAARGEIVGRMRALTSTDAILRSAAEELGRALQVESSRIQLVTFEDSGGRE
jgi:GAF domain-containing protein